MTVDAGTVKTVKTEGPGDRPVPWWGIVLVGLYLIALTTICVIALAQMWPHPTPTTIDEPKENAPPKPVAAPIDEKYLLARCGPPKAAWAADCRRCEMTAHELRTHFGRGDVDNDPECIKILGADVVMWNERRLLLIVILSGALGGLIYAIRSFFWYVGNRHLIMSWVPVYFLAPITSALLGAMIYLVIRGGFFSGMSTISDTSPYTFAALAALVGMFHRETAEKLREIFQIVFTRAASGKDSADLPKPKLTKITPAGPLSRTADTRLTLDGEGFVDQSIVRLDTIDLSGRAVRVSDRELRVIIKPADLDPFDDEVVIRVVNPAPGGGSSDGLKLALEPRPAPAPPDEPPK